ncbi:MAG: GNAT family N-acetyltransferase [Spirochaetaceae bacterium]|nr:MAG: GNAT family N-acetyltransferase [Spirochaetaceae bacterium]
MDALTYEVPSQEDAHELLLFYLTLQNEQPYLHIYPDDALQSVEELQNYLHRLNQIGASRIVVAKESQRIIGCVTVEALTLPDQCGVGELGISVLKEYRDRGIGTRLMREVLSWAAGNAHIHEIILHVADANRRAIHVYTELGFTIEDCEAWDSGTTHGTLCMRIDVAS